MSELNIEDRIKLAEANQNNYHPNSKVVEKIAQKSLVMIVGPAAVGKSFVINRLVKTDPRFGLTRSFTTREPRADDAPETIRCLPSTDESLSELLDMIDGGEVVNYTVHPTTHAFYGTFTDSYPAEYNVMPTLATSVAQLEQIPFKSTHIIGFVADPVSWHKWFNARQFENDDDRRKRLAEAVISLEWLINHPRATMILNKEDCSTECINTIHQVVVEGIIPEGNNKQLAEQLLAAVKQEIQH